jgi:hypothetical protein
MTTSDYALITRLVSIVIVIGSLLWNVWQKFIFVKPTLQVSFGICNVLVPTETGTATRTGHRLLNLTVTNMGPGPVILFASIGKPKTPWWKRPKKLGLLNPIHAIRNTQSRKALARSVRAYRRKSTRARRKVFTFRTRRIVF